MDAKLNSSAARLRPSSGSRGRFSVRNSRDADVPAMLAIYLHHIRRGVDPGIDENEFETPDAEDLKRRRKSMQRRKMPHIVAEDGGVVVGYAYAVPFRKRPAYRYTVKHSIYVHNDHLQARHRPPAHGRADRRLRRGRLPPDDRLYRCRPTAPRSPCTRRSASARSAICLRSASSSATGRTRSWSSARSGPARPSRRGPDRKRYARLGRRGCERRQIRRPDGAARLDDSPPVRARRPRATEGVGRKAGLDVDLLGHQHLAAERLGQVLQARRDIDRVADHGELRVPLVADVAGDDEAGVEADAEADRLDRTVRQRAVQRSTLAAIAAQAAIACRQAASAGP